MTALATLLATATFAYLIHRFAPRRVNAAFRIERFHAPGALADWSPSYYENRRQYRDLVAICGRGDAPQPNAAALAHLERAVQRRISNPSCGSVQPTVGGVQSSF